MRKSKVCVVNIVSSRPLLQQLLVLFSSFMHQVKDRAGKPSMVFLVNTLRDIIKEAHSIIAAAGAAARLVPPTTSSSSSAGGKGPSRASAIPAVVVEYSPSDDSIRVRLANANEGAVAPC